MIANEVDYFYRHIIEIWMYTSQWMCDIGLTTNAPNVRNSDNCLRIVRESFEHYGDRRAWSVRIKSVRTPTGGKWNSSFLREADL